MPGFSSRNLWLMRSFYLEYKGKEKLQPLVAEISWSHNLILMKKCKDLLERDSFLLVIKKYGWTKSVLIHQIESEAYETIFAKSNQLYLGFRRKVQKPG